MRCRTRRSGAFLPSRRAFTRKSADHCVRGREGLALAASTDTVIGVVEARPQGAWTCRPIRYPSPDGRRCAVVRNPPVFSVLSAPYRFRRGTAHGMPRIGLGFDAGSVLSQSESRFATAEWRGPQTCIDCFYGVPRLLGWRPLRAAAKACRNRPFWGQAPAPARRPCSVAALPRARLSVRLAMSRIARPIPAAAAEFFRARPARDDTTMTIGAPCAGGLFIAGGYLPETGGRDETCSRRS